MRHAHNIEDQCPVDYQAAARHSIFGRSLGHFNQHHFYGTAAASTAIWMSAYWGKAENLDSIRAFRLLTDTVEKGVALIGAP
jgi:hypothetical protein